MAPPPCAMCLDEMGFLARPQLFGERLRMEDAFAAMNCKILAFDLDDFKEVIQIHPDLAWSLAHIQASRNHACASRILHAFRAAPAARVKEFIARLTGFHGQLVEDSAGHIFIPPSFTQGEIARMTRLTKVSISRTMKCLCESGLIETRNRRITVLDREGLRSTS